MPQLRRDDLLKVRLEGRLQGIHGQAQLVDYSQAHSERDGQHSCLLFGGHVLVIGDLTSRLTCPQISLSLALSKENQAFRTTISPDTAMLLETAYLPPDRCWKQIFVSAR
jgi:hypothetical protein